MTEEILKKASELYALQEKLSQNLSKLSCKDPYIKTLCVDTKDYYLSYGMYGDYINILDDDKEILNFLKDFYKRKLDNVINEIKNLNC